MWNDGIFWGSGVEPQYGPGQHHRQDQGGGEKVDPRCGVLALVLGEAQGFQVGGVGDGQARER